MRCRSGSKSSRWCSRANANYRRTERGDGADGVQMDIGGCVRVMCANASGSACPHDASSALCLGDRKWRGFACYRSPLKGRKWPARPTGVPRRCGECLAGSERIDMAHLIQTRPHETPILLLDLQDWPCYLEYALPALQLTSTSSSIARVRELTSPQVERSLLHSGACQYRGCCPK